MFGSLFGNVIGTVYFIYFQIAGIMLAYALLKRERPSVRIVLGSVFGSVLLHWVPVLFSFLFNFGVLSHVIAAITLIPIFVLFIKKEYINNRESLALDGREVKLEIKQHKAFLIFFAIIFILWCYLLYTHAIRFNPEDGAIYTGQCDYGDMNMHLGFITSIAVQGTFPPDYSIFPGTKLAYPFLSDSISSSIYIFGASLRWAFILPMLAAFGQVVCGAYILACSFLKSVKKSVVSMIFFFLNGGLGFIYFLNWTSGEGGYKFSDIFTGFYTTPTNLTSENIRWVNIIADMLLPQRATLFGYAILFSAIYLLYSAVFKGKRENLIYAAVLGGALPLIHTHSFLSFGLVAASFLLMQLYMDYKQDDFALSGWKIVLGFLAFMLVIQYLRNKNYLPEDRLMPIAIAFFALLVVYGLYLIYKYIKKNGYKEILLTWGIFLVVVFALALPQLFGFTFGQVSEGGFVRGCFNWGNQGENYIWFYVKNMGIVLILGVAAICGAGKKLFTFMFPVLPIWFLAEMIAFAPNNYDNNKLIYVAYLFVCIAAADFAVDVFDKTKIYKGMYVFAGVVFFFATFSGVLSLGREAYSDLQLYGTDQVEMAKWIEDNTEPEDVFLTNDRHNNIIPSMTGRNIVCGSGAFLYYHGINTSERNEAVKLMYEDPYNNLDLYDKYDVSYVCYSPYEWGNYTTDSVMFDDLFELVFEYEGTRLYKVK